MCFNLKQKAYAAYKRAIYNNDKNEAAFWKSVYEEQEAQGIDYHLARGVVHPELLTYTNTQPYNPVRSFWGLVPENGLLKDIYWKNMSTLNARGETLFEKKSFQEAAEKKRCLIPVEGFYEYHTANGRKYPFHIKHKKENELLYLAGLWSEWNDKKNGTVLHTFTIVTTKANPLMAKIHNKPKSANDHRMPVILPEELRELWLKPLSKPEIKEIATFQYPGSELEAWTVRPLSGLQSPGNDPKATEKVEYPGFDLDGKNEPTLF